MTKTIRLNDLQLVLLSSAAARDNASLIPLPQNCTQESTRIDKAVAALLRHALVEEVPVTDRRLAWRDQDQDPIGLFITNRGRKAIGSEPAESAAEDGIGVSKDNNEVDPAADQAEANAVEEVDKVSPASATPTARHDVRPASKIAGVIALLGRKEGATLTELTGATGWQAHTTRAALSGLRKKGHVIEKTKRGDATCYRIVAEQNQ